MIYHAATCNGFITNYADALKALDIPLAQGKRTPAQQRTAMCLLRACREGSKAVVAMNWNSDTHIVFMGPIRDLENVIGDTEPISDIVSLKTEDKECGWDGAAFVSIFEGTLEEAQRTDPFLLDWEVVPYTFNLDKALREAGLTTGREGTDRE